jgi:hypothetical protein
MSMAIVCCGTVYQRTINTNTNNIYLLTVLLTGKAQRQATKGTKAGTGTARYKERQGQTQRRARKDTKAGKARQGTKTDKERDKGRI